MRRLLRKIYRLCFTTCAHCGEGFSMNYNPVEYPGFETEPRGRLDGEPNLLHWGVCAGVAGVTLKKRQLIADGNRVDISYEAQFGMYYGSYSWWREIVLHEDHDVAVRRAAEHIQRSTSPCEKCEGEGSTLEAGVDFGGEGAREDIQWIRMHCEKCDGTGHPRAQYPVPNELVA